MISRWAGLLLMTLSVTACGAHASWSRKTQKSPLYRVPDKIQLYLLVSEKVDQEDENGFVATVVETLTNDLTGHGHPAELVLPKLGDAPPLPRVELRFLDFSGGDAGLRVAGHLVTPLLALGAGSGAAIDVYVLPGPAEGMATFMGRIGTDFSVAEPSSLGEKLGHLISSEILTPP